MDFKDKKILILAGAGPHTKVVESAKEMGIYTIVADNLPTSRYSPAKLLADESLRMSIFDVEELTVFARKNKIDGVIGLCIDPAQRPCQKIAESLQISAFGTWDQVISLTCKKVFKGLCTDTGVDTIPEYSEKNMKSDAIDYPVFVKPIDSRGSRGTAVCHDRQELINALSIAKKESSNGDAIIEKYMGNNQDLTISYLVKDGIPTLISIGDRYPGRAEDNLERQLSCTIQPSRYVSMYMENVNERVVKMIKHIGIKNGPIFMQGFVDGDTVRMYDPGIRLPGNEYERIYKAATGIDLMKSIISYIVGGEIDDYGGKIAGSYDLNGLCAIQYMINVGAGEIAKIEGLDEIKKDLRVVDVQQRYFVGDIIENTGDIKHRAGEISILVGRNSKEMSGIIRFIQEKLVIEDKEGNNLIISPINAKKIENIYTAGYSGSQLHNSV